MEKLIVTGGAELKGSIGVSGSKNASLPILAATLLTREPCTIRRVPDVSDTNYMLQILRSLGAEVERASGTVTVCAENIHADAPYDLVRKMRASICVMGPLLARLHEARVSLPGGCVIGDRPVDLHLKGLGELGADVSVSGGDIIIKAGDGLRGKRVHLFGKHGPTVLGTDNLIMAATLASGTTIIEEAACEPEVTDLIDFLNRMGARIHGAGSRTITVEGVGQLHGADHTVIPDRIEAGTFVIAAAMAGSRVTVHRARADHLQALFGVLRESGFAVAVDGDRITTGRAAAPCGCEVITEPYPGFPTDMQAQLTSLFATVPGISVITEKIFPQRFMHVAELNRMGAHIQLEGATAIVKGVPRLSGAPVMASDLRASAALVLAGLCAEGETEINRLYHIDRGYEHIDEKLMELGADMRRESV